MTAFHTLRTFRLNLIMSAEPRSEQCRTETGEPDYETYGAAVDLPWRDRLDGPGTADADALRSSHRA